MGRHNREPEASASSPPPARITLRDLLTWPLFGLGAAIALVLGVVIGLLID